MFRHPSKNHESLKHKDKDQGHEESGQRSGKGANPKIDKGKYNKRNSCQTGKNDLQVIPYASVAFIVDGGAIF